MSSVNKVIIIGNLGKDPEFRTFQNGGRIANMAVATSERWKDKTSGDWKEKVEWHRITVQNDHILDNVLPHLSKGTKVYIEGQLETRKWTDKKSNEEKYSTDIVVSKFKGILIKLDPKDKAEKEDAMPPATTDSLYVDNSLKNRPTNTVPMLDDSIPF